MTTDDERGLERLMLFSDGVFAIAITLLVLPLADAEIEPGHVGESLIGLLPRMLTFLLSFAVIGRYWILHHGLFRRVARADRRLLLLNMAYLFAITFLPFPTSVLGPYGDSVAATLLYSLNLVAINVMVVALVAYALRNPDLRTGDTTPELARVMIGRALAPTLALVPAVPLAFVSPTWAKLSWLLLIPFSRIGDRMFPLPEGVTER